MSCINPNSPEFKAALERTGNPLLAEIEVDKQQNMSSLGKLEGDLMQSEKGQIGVNKQQLLMLLGPTMYNKPLAQVAVKELLQNSFDAVKARQNISDNKNTGNIEIKVNYDNRTISIKDDGIGMTPTIVKNAFLSIGGTNKEGLDVSERSGGFGLAKVQFLLGSEYVKVLTVRDGIKTTLEASSVQLYNDDFEIFTEQTDEPNGSFVEVKIPESYTTPEGTKREIDFPGKYYSNPYSRFDILDKPLIGDVNINFTWIKNNKTESNILPIGINSDETTLPPLFSKIDFKWGSADLYMSTEKTENPNHRILSSGIYQFSHRFKFKDWENIPYNIVVNIKPSVSSTSEQYPFNNQREDFKNTVQEDIKSLNNYLKKYASGEAEKDAKAVFSNITGLPKVDPSKVLTLEEREKLYADVEKTIEENKKRRIEQGVESVEEQARKIYKLIIDETGVKNQETGELEVSKEKNYGSTFKAEKEIEKVDAIEVTNFNPALPQYHNNTNVDYLSIDGAAEFFSDFGSVVLEMVRFAGNELGYSYEKLKSEDEKFFAGVSIDKQYGGVHVRKIINAIFVNPLAFNVSSLEEAVGVALHVAIHEINHTTVSGEGAEFTTALGVLYGKIYATGKYGLYEGLFRSVYKKHFETFKKLKYEYDKSSTRNLSESFEGEQIETSSFRNVQRNVNDVSTGQSSEERYRGDQESDTKDKTGDIILSNFTSQYVAGFREFVGKEQSSSEPMLQLEGETESSRVSNQTLAIIKDFLSRIGVDIKKMDDIVVDGVKMDANGAALIAQKLVLVTEGKENVALTEEAMHFAVEIIEQKDPKLFNELLKEINSYRLLTTIINDYGKLSMYQTSDGKPDIRKLKKEAIAKVLTEVIINKNEGITEKPQLLAKVETWWQKIINALKGLFSTSGFDRAAMMILKGEAIGSVDDIRLNNDVFLQENITPQQRIVNQIRMVSASIKKPVNEGDKYEINGKKIRNRVTEISKTWLDNLFADKKLTEDEFDKAVNDVYAQSGTGLHADVHKMLINNLLDVDGKFIKNPALRKNDDSYVSQLSPLNKKFYNLLKSHMEDRLASFPDDTVFLSEMTIYDPKRDLAGTVDFIAIEPSGKTHILDWKFIKINNAEYQEDVPWYSVGYWRRQMKNYKLILSNAYGVDFDGTEQTRMIPFRAIYSRMDKKKGIKPQLMDLEVGSVDPKIEERSYLVPVGLEEERTGQKRVDALIDQLNQVYDLISEKKVIGENKKEKAEQLNELYKAIRQLKMRNNLSPLIHQAGVLNKAVEKLITEYYNNWEGKDISEFSQEERNDFSSRITDFENSLVVYSELYKNLRPLFQGEISEKDKKIKDELRDVTEDAREFQISLEEVRNKFAEKIAESMNVWDYLKPEKIIKGFSSWFGTTSTLQNKSAQVLYKMANRAFALSAMETQSQGDLLLDIKKRYDQWAKSKGFNNKNYFDIIKKKPGDNKEGIELKRKAALDDLREQKDFYTDEEFKNQEKKINDKYDKELKGKNELIDEYDYKFYSDLRKKSKDKDFEWIRENIDVEEYKKHIAEKREKEIERANNKTRYGSDFAKQRQLDDEISKIEALHDVASSEGLGWLLYDETRKFPKEKWKSEQWKELYKKDGAGNYVNAPAVELFEYIKSRNEFFEEIGYINPKQERTFLPFVRKGLVEKIVMGGDVTLFEGALRSITVTEGDVGYGQIDPITKKPVYTIPKYFTRDTGEEISDDLFKNMTLVNEAAIRYRYLTEMEKQMHLIINTESNKNAIKTSYFGKTKINADGEPEFTNDNTENTQLVRDMMESIIYGHKFVESQNFDQLLFGLGKMGKKFNDKLGIKIFPEEFDDSKISLNKSINWLNNAFQLKALGLNPLSALATLLGGSFQSTINAGKYFTKSEFAKNQFILVSRMNGVDAKKYMGALEYFLPLTENYNTIIAKKLSLSKFSQEGVQDALMILMRKADQYIQSVNFFSYLDNTIVMDGKLINAREYLRTTPEYANIYSVSGDERKALNNKFEEDLKKLVAEKGVMNVAVVEDGKFTIPGIERKSDTVVNLRRVVQGITKDALGNLSEDDVRRINLNIYGKSFMVFKNWIPRLLDVRIGNLKYNSATDAYEWGRTRMIFRWIAEEKFKALDSLKSAMFGNDEKFVAQMRALYERKKMDYEKDTGKKLRMTEAEFVEMAAQNVKNQMVDLLFYLALTGLVMAATRLKDDDDDDRAVKNRYNYMIRALDKIRDEVAYFSNPTQLLNLSKTGLFPAISMIDNYKKVFDNFIKEMYAISIDDDKAAEKNYVIKYGLKGLPITSQFDAIFLIFFPDLAKDLGMRSQPESRPIGR